MRQLLIVVSLAACQFHPGGVGIGDDAGNLPRDAAGSGDATAIDGPPCPTSFSTLYSTCGAMFGGPVSLTDPAGCYSYNTDTHVLGGYLCSDNGTVFTLPSPTTMTAGTTEVLMVGGFTLGAGVSLTVTGTSPLAILANGSVTIAGKLDVRAGARTASACGTSAGTNGTAADGGGGGGGGGAFQQAGLAGGNSMGSGGAGGTTTAAPSAIVGGCPGGTGGRGNQGLVAASGAGGGAVYIASSSTIVISGLLNAGGGGGGGGDGDTNNNPVGYRGGGGGGGSGGMVWLEAGTLAIQGVLAANGGGGGEGASTGGPGSPGEDGRAATTRAAGGSGNGNGGNGGAGGTGVLPAGTGSNQSGGGAGGGGGGAGFIKLQGARSGGGVISPPPL